MLKYLNLFVFQPSSSSYSDNTYSDKKTQNKCSKSLKDNSRSLLWKIQTILW